MPWRKRIPAPGFRRVTGAWLRAGAGVVVVRYRQGGGGQTGSYDETPIVEAQSAWHHVCEGPCASRAGASRDVMEKWPWRFLSGPAQQKKVKRKMAARLAEYKHEHEHSVLQKKRDVKQSMWSRTGSWNMEHGATNTKGSAADGRVRDMDHRP